MISFVVPVYRSAESLPELHWRLVAQFGSTPAGFELIFVEDCGGDQWAQPSPCCQGFQRDVTG
jgi:undecaprenyl-phosphate 4-deoxy-4-formamido-L-arabinose transferase